MNRRDALKTIGGLAGAASLARVLPGCGDDGPPAVTGITTYVYMMMENRSYDHWFGARKLVEGKPGDGLTATMTIPDLANQPVAPWEPTQNQECDIDPPHDWDAQHASFNSGACDGFVKQHQMTHASGTAIEPMQYVTREQVPVSYALADAYAVADRWFCSVMGPTWPNRFYWHTGSSRGIKANVLPTGGGGISGPSIYHLLEAKGVDWAYYYGNIPVVSLVADLNIDGHVRRMKEFFLDAKAGTLPPVVYIDPAFGENDDHPPSHPINGQELIASVYQALATSPQWNNIMFVLTYDENGGFFDHVPPPTSADDFAADGFDQLGFRVPTLVMGPYVKEGYVSSVPLDHTSALKHLINVFELDPTALGKRTSAATDLTDFIDQERLANVDPRPPIEIPVVDVTAWPMGPGCVGEAIRVAAPHPMVELADQHPERIAGLDLRGEIADYRAAIRASLGFPRVR
ncbi:MAG: phosphoesterase [Proteobacteria bacterium]|nr:phosphoesterase [Pseudomonadota bacterium]